MNRKIVSIKKAIKRAVEVLDFSKEFSCSASAVLFVAFGIGGEKIC